MSQKQLTKSPNNRMLTGTIAGICEYFGWSPDIITFVRMSSQLSEVGEVLFLYTLLPVGLFQVLEVMLGDKTTAEQMKKTGQAMRTVGKANLHLTHLAVR